MASLIRSKVSRIDSKVRPRTASQKMVDVK